MLGFDRTRDKAVQTPGAKDSVKQTVDASANSAILGRNWVVPLFNAIGADVNRAAATGLLFGRNTGALTTPTATGVVQKTIESALRQAPHQPFTFKTGADPDTIIHTPIDLGEREVDAEYHSAQPLPPDLITLLKTNQIVIEASEEDDLAERDDLDHWYYDIETGEFVQLVTPTLARQSQGHALVFDEETGEFVPLA